MTRLDLEAVRTAYRRQAASYDYMFGLVSRAGRRRAVAAVNTLPGDRVLEVGVGTGLALPYYTAGKRVTGIDLSTEMLARARARVASQGLTQVESLLERNAEATDFPNASFDIAVSMFVASVVPNPRALLAELRRVVRPGGHILFVRPAARHRTWLGPPLPRPGVAPRFCRQRSLRARRSPGGHVLAGAAGRDLHARPRQTVGGRTAFRLRCTLICGVRSDIPNTPSSGRQLPADQRSGIDPQMLTPGKRRAAGFMNLALATALLGALVLGVGPAAAQTPAPWQMGMALAALKKRVACCSQPSGAC